MNIGRRLQLALVVISLLGAGWACQLTGDETALPPTQTPIVQVVTATGQVTLPTPPGPTSDSLSPAQKQQLARATVRIVIMKKSGGKLVPLGTGSGTILSKDGVILTNCHVADPAAMGASQEESPDALVVELVESEDRPPVATYTAKLLASDGTLDLAVIKIDKKMDGSTVNPAALSLPYVTIGNSDEVKFGDPVFIFGFPGIGGQTITYTSGSVSGFDSMTPIGNRAWMKTDATIAGGNSGGLAANARAEIIGIPTRLGTSSATKMTDCRQIADTNGDGKINEKDTCVPTGGFINAIRPVNWAKTMIDAGLKGIAYSSPYSTTKATPTKEPPKTVTAKFSLNGWATEVDKSNCPVQVLQSFASGIKKIYAVFQFSNMLKGDNWKYRWLLDNREVSSDQSTWQNEESRKCFSFSLENQGKVLPDGEYKLEIFSGQNLDLVGTASTRVGGTGKTSKTSPEVQVKGKVIDANTKKGIAGIYVIILQPGIDPDDWLNNDGLDSDILTDTQTDASGAFTLPDLLPRGQEYGAVAGSKKLGYQSSTGYLEIQADDPDVITLTIELKK